MNRIEEKYGLKPSHAYALFAILVLNILWLICGTIIAIQLHGGMPLYQIVNIIMLAATAYYACYAYKKPHGNHMRYLILCSAAYSAIRNITSSFARPTYIIVISYLIIILKTYMAGRLDHYKQNVIISAVILACQCAMVYYNIDAFTSAGFSLTFVYVMSTLGPVTLWLAIAGAYITRFKLHKQAGLED